MQTSIPTKSRCVRDGEPLNKSNYASRSTLVYKGQFFTMTVIVE